jgi:hypothetical protein
MSYAWIIDKDMIQTNAKGTIGPIGAEDRHVANLARRRGVEFRLYDDDGDLCYVGRIVGNYDGFEPLDDFGEGYAGCTMIKYRNERGAWEIL